MVKPKRPVVVLLGMHRSGTSLTMSVLNALGIKCGDDLIPPGRGNESGFWEHAAVVTAHERLLAELDRVWDGPKGSYPLPDGWLDSGAAERARKQLVQIVEREVTDAGDSVWGFKDPRTCRLLPLWNQVFEESGGTPQYILAVRNPAAVCASLRRHNGMGPARSGLLWLQYNVEPLQHCADRLRLVIDYDRLIEQPECQVERLSAALNPYLDHNGSEKKQAIARVAPKMRRTAADLSSAHNAIIDRVYYGIQALAKDQEPDQRLSQFVADFTETQRLFECWRSDRKHALLDLATRLIIRGRYT